VREIFRLIDWMMHLRVDLEERFKHELDELEESLQMPYVTSVERIAKNEAAIETRQQTLIRQLRRRFGKLPAKVTRAINATTTADQLDEWLDRFATANSLDEMGF
jgi:ATP-dependent RNA circularization protein (DNA/RNA ligase family)